MSINNSTGKDITTENHFYFFRRALSYLDNVRKIIEKIGSSVKETMGIDNINVWFKDQDFNEILQTEFEKVSQNEKIIYKDDLYDEAFSSLFIRNKEPRLINEVLLQELKINDEYKEIILKEKFALLIPVFIKDVLIGTMNLERNLPVKLYSDEDIDLLKTLASQGAIAFENSRLQKKSPEAGHGRRTSDSKKYSNGIIACNP
ncbi:MAG: GAF domain-containing protein [Ignavibacteria bacterium]